jgi:CubicO group peptidase (beta-lactamase class C family)
MGSNAPQDKGREIRAVVEKAVEFRIFPGCVVGIVDDTGERSVEAYGRHTYDESGPTVAASTIYDVASVTKVIPTSTLALKAIENGLLSPDSIVQATVPEFRGRYASAVTIGHCLTQTLDWGFSLSSLRDLPAEQMLDSIYTRDLRSPPGEWFGYCNATSILLGVAVERAFGAPLDRLADELLFRPLGMADTGFLPRADVRERIAPSEIDDWRGGTVRGEVHDESAWVLQRIMTPGSAGLFSTVPDLLNFLQMLLCGGLSGSSRVLDAETIGSVQTNRLESIGKCAALGWELRQLRFMGLQCSEKTVGKTGFTGCLVMCDFGSSRALAFLSNHTYPRRRQNADAINVVRRDIADIAFG